jgi:alpha-galactosidase
VTLWSIARSPLIAGGDLTAADAWTKSLLTNANVIAVDQHSTGNRPVVQTADTVSWVARPDILATGASSYVAVFNLQNTSRRVDFAWSDLGVPNGKWRSRDLWKVKDIPHADGVHLTLGPHGCVLYRVFVAK